MKDNDSAIKDLFLALLILSLLAIVITVVTLIYAFSDNDILGQETEKVVVHTTSLEMKSEILPVVKNEKVEILDDYVPLKPVIFNEELNTKPLFDLTDAEIDLISCIVYNEARGETEDGKRLVIDVILNRMNDSRFPDTVDEVIFQPGQFACYIDESYMLDEYCDLVREELIERVSDEVLYFRTGHFHNGHIDLFVVGNHYFSK